MAYPITTQSPVTPQLFRKNAAEMQHNQKMQQSPPQHSQAADTVSLSYNRETALTYSSSLSAEKIADKGYEMLRKLVTNMLEEQGINHEIAIGSSTVDIQNITQEEAQELISEDGYFGVAKTSDRIVDFAISAAGGDRSKLEVIKEGVQKGFDDALQAFGGSLPDISHDTLEAVMEKLDNWAAETSESKA